MLCKTEYVRIPEFACTIQYKILNKIRNLIYIKTKISNFVENLTMCQKKLFEKIMYKAIQKT